MIQCFVSSATGNTLTFVPFIEKHLNQEMELYHGKDLVNARINSEKIIIGSWTKFGKIPIDIKDFLFRNRHLLKGRDIFIFGSGYTVFDDSNRAIKNIKRICSEYGAKSIQLYGFEQSFHERYLSERMEQLLIKKIKTFEMEK